MTQQRRPIFGPIDPYCLLPVAPLAGFGLVLLFVGEPLLGVGLLVIAVLIVLFDSFANRNQRRPSRRQEAERGDW
jgi:hypothetical protein